MMRFVILTAVLGGAACASSPAPMADGLTRPPFPSAENRAAFGLAHVDVETTGLDPLFHEMIDAGIIYTDLNGAELGRLYVRIMPDHPERLSDGARAVNGFDVAYWRANGAVSEAEAVNKILAFHREMGAGRTMIFTAWNAQFDTRFVSALLAEHGANFRELFHYHVLDIPSMAWGFGVEQMTGSLVGPRFGVEPETRVPLDHTGLSGAEFNVAVYRQLIAARRSTKSQ